MNNEKQWWIFTFGYGQKYEGYYVKIWGTYDSAREIMFDRFGSEWAFQYTTNEWTDWENRRPSWMKPEILMEEIRY